jgi:hypothetical protein
MPDPGDLAEAAFFLRRLAGIDDGGAHRDQLLALADRLVGAMDPADAAVEDLRQWLFAKIPKWEHCAAVTHLDGVLVVEHENGHEVGVTIDYIGKWSDSNE